MLTDEVFQCYAEVLSLRNARCLVFSSTAHSAIVGISGKREKKFAFWVSCYLIRFTSHAHVFHIQATSIWDREQLLFPMFEAGRVSGHFSVIQVDIKQRRIRHFDSMPRERSTLAYFHNVRDARFLGVSSLTNLSPKAYLNWLHKKWKVDHPDGASFDRDSWEQSMISVEVGYRSWNCGVVLSWDTIQGVPQQVDPISCGVYACATVDILSQGKEPTANQDLNLDYTGVLSYRRLIIQRLIESSQIL